MNESLTDYLLTVRGANNGTKNFPNLYVGVMMSNLNRKCIISIKQLAVFDHLDERNCSVDLYCF